MPMSLQDRRWSIPPRSSNLCMIVPPGALSFSPVERTEAGGGGGGDGGGGGGGGVWWGVGGEGCVNIIVWGDVME